MEIRDVTPTFVAKAVHGKIEHGNNVICHCPVHEKQGTHNPSLLLTVNAGRVMYHCRSQHCDKRKGQIIRDFLIKAGIPEAQIGAKPNNNEIHYDYHGRDGAYMWTKTRRTGKTGKKRFVSGVYDAATNSWVSGRPEGVPLLFNLPTIVAAIGGGYPVPLLIVEGEKDVLTATGLGVLATTNADGAGKWRMEDSQTLAAIGVKEVCVCPDNDAPGIDHGITVATMCEAVGMTVTWLELPDLEMKGDLSDWVKNRPSPESELAELIGKAPRFDRNAIGWRQKLMVAGQNSNRAYSGETANIEIALQYEPKLKGVFIYNAFRHRVEATSRTPWCQDDWWQTSALTPLGYRPVSDADYIKLGTYLVTTYNFAKCGRQDCRDAILAAATDRQFDELSDWIDALPDWDGIARLDSWLVRYAGADVRAHGAEYLAMVGTKFVMQVLNRAMNPGAKADYSLVLTSAQGGSKDQVLEAMFQPYYHEGVPSPKISQADFGMALAGSIVTHGAEMSAWKKADIEEQKACLTRCIDRSRPAYGIEVKVYPRRTSIAFSTNDVEFLQDPTGSRRYWPVTVDPGGADIEGLRRDRDQLLAEALHRLAKGELHWPTPEEEARVFEIERERSMPEGMIEIVATIERYVTEAPETVIPANVEFGWKWNPRAQPLTELYLDDFFAHCYGQWSGTKRGNLDRASKSDISACTNWLRKNGWVKRNKRDQSGQQKVVWRATKTGSSEPEIGSSGSANRPKQVTNVDERVDAGAQAPSAIAAEATGETGAGAEKPTKIGKGGPKKGRKTLGSAVGSAGQTVDNTTVDDPMTQMTQELGNSHVHARIYARDARGVSKVGSAGSLGQQMASVEEADDLLRRDRFVALDIETTGLSATLDKVRTVQLCDGETAILIVFDRPVKASRLTILKDLLEGRRIVVHSARFEGAWFREAGIDIVLDDTALIFSAVRGMRQPGKKIARDDGSSRISLAALALMVLGIELDKTEQTSDWSAEVLTEKQLTYAIDDAIVTHAIWEALRKELHDKSAKFGVDIAAGYDDLRYSAAMARDMEHAGIGFDVEAHRAWMDRKQQQADALDAHILTLDPVLTPTCIASGVQLDAHFRQLIEVRPKEVKSSVLRSWPKTGKTRRISFARDALADVLVADRLPPEERTLVEALYARMDSARGLTSFGTSFVAHVRDGRLYGQLHAGGAVTGRYTSTDPNLQNIPADKEFRGFLRSPPGRKLVDVDYSQLELRVFAAMSNDRKMIDAFEAGWDYHDLVAKMTGCTRRQAKVINFGIIYGMAAATLAADLGITEEEAGAYLRGWNEQAPEGANWRAERPYLYRVEGGLRTARRWIDYLDDDNSDSRSGTRPMNFPVQGGAGDVLHRAMRKLYERYHDWPGDCLPVLTIHDEIIVEADADHADEVGGLLADAMTEAYVDVLPNGPTRFLAIPGIGHTWSEAKAEGEVREKALRAEFVA